MAIIIPKTSAPSDSREGLQIILRPKNLVSGLQPEYILDHYPATIGRHAINDIELPFESVSRYHARIELHGTQLHLVDLRSSNGTFVNGKRVQLAPIADHDTIAFGSIDFTLLLNDRKSSQEPDRHPGEETAVQFVMREDQVQTIFHAELPDDSSHADVLEDEITNEAHLKKAKQRLISLYRLQEVLRSTTDEERLLRSVLNLLFDVLPVDRGVILTRDGHDASVYRPVAIKVKSGADGENIGISKTILQRCLREKVAILTRDATSDSRFKASESVVFNKMRSVMCAPLISARHIFGFCHLDTTDAVRSFTEEDLTFLAHVGQEVATHLHNLRMLQEKIVSERMAAIGQTITGMAHNIKNILVLSQGGMEMMEKRLHDKKYESLDETWAVVHRGVDRINKLVQDMLDYSRARKIEKRKLNVNEFVEEMSLAFGEELAKRGVSCQLNFDEDCPPLMLDVDGLHKALANLILNSLEACAEGTGRIELGTHMTEDGSLVLSVQDNAGGIPKEVLPRIFVPFFTTKGSRGSGLGLAMTKKIIEDMGGRIGVKSTEGVGTCFTIMFHVGPENPKIAPQAKRGRKASQ